MGQRCKFGEHVPCGVCGAFVAPTSKEHVHLGNPSDSCFKSICTTCWSVLNICAIPILEVITRSGITKASSREIRKFLAERVIIAVQDPLDLETASRN